MKKPICLLLFIHFFITLFSQPGTLVSNFGNHGIKCFNISKDKESCDPKTSVIDANGKLIVAGNVQHSLDNYIGLARLNPDGSFDQAFGDSGKVYIKSQLPKRSTISSIAIDKFNRIVISGTTFRSYTYSIFVIRLNEDGHIDNTFGSVGKVTYSFEGECYASGLGIDSNGKIVVGGYADNNGDKDFCLIRLNENGELDYSFNYGRKLLIPVGLNEDISNDLTIDKYNRILMVGKSLVNTKYSFSIVRINTNGTPDNSFHGNGRNIFTYDTYDSGAQKIVLGENDTIILAGTVHGSYAGIVKLDPDGNLVTKFGTNGILRIPGLSWSPTFNDVKIDRNKKIVLAGYTDSYDGLELIAIRLNSNGTFDNSFNSNGKLIFPLSDECEARNLIIDKNGKLNILAIFALRKFSVLKLNDDGTSDLSFNKTGFLAFNLGTYSEYVTDFILDKQGRLLIAGTYVPPTAYQKSFLIRMLPNGSMDATFGKGGMYTPESNLGTGNFKIAIDKNDKIVLASILDDTHTPSDLSITIRLNPDGTYDTTFNKTGMIKNRYGNIDDLRTDKDGKIVIAAKGLLVRLNADGSVDNTFNNGMYSLPTHTQDSPDQFMFDSFGNILVASSLYSYDYAQSTSFYDFLVAKLKPVGPLTENNFYTSTGYLTFRLDHYNTASAIDIDNTGKIIVGGNTTSDYKNYNFGFVALKGDGSIQYEKTYKIGFNSILTNIVCDKNNNVYATGYTHSGEDSAFLITRLDKEGNFDWNFGEKILTNGVCVSTKLDANYIWMVGHADGDIKIVKLNAYNFSLTINATNGSVTKNPDKVDYTNGEKVTLTAIPNSGYGFVSWSGDITGSANPVSVTMDASKSVTANFERIYTLTTNATNGSVTKSPDKVDYTNGEKVTLTAIPNSGYGFVSWSGDVTGSANPASVTMDANKSVTANFEPIYTLTTNAVNGTVTRTPDNAVYTTGNVVTLTASPNSGYRFVSWSGDVTGSANPASVTIDANKLVTANFEPIYTLTTNAVNGTVTRTPDNAVYTTGNVVTLTASPNSGYRFVSWSGDVTGSENPASVTIDANKLVTANFELLTKIDIIDQSTFKVYPNPFYDFITIEAERINVLVRIYNLSGRIIKELKTDKNITKINLAYLNPGSYLLYLASDSNVIIQLIIKQ